MPVCSFVPPHILRRVALHGEPGERRDAIAALELSALARRERAPAAVIAGMLTLGARRKRRAIYDAKGTRELPGLHARSEGSRPVRDAEVNAAYESLGRVHDFLRRVFGRHSVDGNGSRLEATVHYGQRFSNAQWDGRRVIYGDGDGRYFHRFTSSIDVAAHELGHGITQYSAGLGASGQCGALGEHFSDVFAILAKQYWLGESAAESDWLIGASLLTDRVHGVAIRSLKAPGSAYDDPILGRDPQPSHYRDFLKTRAGDGGVHVNSGIANHAFYRAAIHAGGTAWEGVGQIWYRALTRHLGPRSNFRHAAEATNASAGELFGPRSRITDAVREAWDAVGIAKRHARRTRSERSIPKAGVEFPAPV